MGLEWAAGGTNGRKSRRKASPWLNQRREREIHEEMESSQQIGETRPFLLRARFHSHGNIGAPLFPFPFLFNFPFFFQSLFCSTPSLSLPLSFTPFFQGPINGSSPWPRSFVRSGCRATPSGKISSQVSSDTRGVTYRRGPSAGIVASLELAPG